jgi:hypothetical protein
MYIYTYTKIELMIRLPPTYPLCNVEVCIYMYIYINLYTKIYRLRVRVRFIYIYEYIYVYVYIYINVYIYTNIHIYIYIYTCIYTCIYTYIQVESTGKSGVNDGRWKRWVMQIVQLLASTGTIILYICIYI